MATEIRMDERGQKKQGQVNCGAKREGLPHGSIRYWDKNGNDKKEKEGDQSSGEGSKGYQI